MLTRLTQTPTILDAEKFRVAATASTQSIDAQDEIILASGWQLNRVEAQQVKLLNAHNSCDIRDVLGTITDAYTAKGALTCTLDYAVKQSPLAAFAWDMMLGGFLTGYSVGGRPLLVATLTDIKSNEGKVKWKANKPLFKAAAEAAGLTFEVAADRVKSIVVQIELCELSVVPVPCNPDAMVRAYDAGALTDESFERAGFDSATREFIENTARAWHGFDATARGNICELLTSISRNHLQTEKGTDSRAIEPAQRERIERQNQQRAETLEACKALAAKLAAGANQ